MNLMIELGFMIIKKAAIQMNELLPSSAFTCQEWIL